MTPRFHTMAVLGAILAVMACETPQPLAPAFDPTPRFAQAPSAGNGNKLVFPINTSTSVDCGGETIIRNDRGWFQVRVFPQSNNRNVELDVFHVTVTYTNSAGKTFVWHDVGPDHYYIDRNGDFILTMTGRSTASGNITRDHIVVGHVVANLTTGQITLLAGNEQAPVNVLACEALT